MTKKLGRAIRAACYNFRATLHSLIGLNGSLSGCSKNI